MVRNHRLTFVDFETAAHTSPLKNRQQSSQVILCVAYAVRRRISENVLTGLTTVIKKMKVPVIYDLKEMDIDLRIDLLVNDCVVVELKAIENILPVHQAQLLTYMKLLKKPQGLLINFFTDNISKAAIPLVNEFYAALPD